MSVKKLSFVLANKLVKKGALKVAKFPFATKKNQLFVSLFFCYLLLIANF